MDTMEFINRNRNFNMVHNRNKFGIKQRCTYGGQEVVNGAVK